MVEVTEEDRKVDAELNSILKKSPSKYIIPIFWIASHFCLD
jgi:hypothetical protein